MRRVLSARWVVCGRSWSLGSREAMILRMRALRSLIATAVILAGLPAQKVLTPELLNSLGRVGSLTLAPDDNILIPLFVDNYFLQTIAAPNLQPLGNSLGVLDLNGQATATFTLPANTNPGLAGLQANRRTDGVHGGPGGEQPES